MQRKLTLAAATTAVSMLIAAGSVQAAPEDGNLSPGEVETLAAGLQLAPKADSAPKGTPNPYLALVPDQSTADYAYWRKVMKQGALERAASPRLTEAKRAASGGRLAAPFVYDEKERPGTNSNDSTADAERITAFGIGAAKNNRVRILGSLASFAGSTRTLAPVPEDNGSIPLAGATGLDGQDKITTTGTLGDGPHGSAGDATGDFDAYKLTAPAGQQIVVDTSATTLDTYVALYDAAGNLLATDDDGGTGLASLLTYDVTASGDYYAFVAGYRSGNKLPADPFDSGSGPGTGREGNYGLTISVDKVDRDYYGVYLRKGDVLGGNTNTGADELSVTKPDGTRMIGTEQDASFLYPPESPLPGGGAAVFGYVAEEAGWYAINVGGPTGAYDVLLEVYRPGGLRTAGPVQRVYLDFRGGRVNTAVWGGGGVTNLSPFSTFLASWGLTAADEAEVVRGITAEVNENLKLDAMAAGYNPNVQVRILNSRNTPDIWGQDRVQRVVVAGTIAESGVNTIGIAQYIDPGNYNMRDQALVLLDVMSGPAGGSASLNTYMNETSDRVAFVSQAVGNIVAHEIGHLIGNYHTDNTNLDVNIMDAGGNAANFPRLFGVGEDGVGGTADDNDADLGFDTYSLVEGFTGMENTLNVDAWAWTKR